MKRMSKLLALVFVFILSLLTMATGCTPNLLEEYNAAVAKTETLTELHAKCTMQASASAGGITFDIPLNMEMKAKLADNKISELWMSTQTSMLGENIDQSSFYKDGFLYTEAMGNKYKTEMSVDELMEDTVSTDNALELTEEILKDAERTVKDGIVTVKLSFDGNILAEKLLEMLPSDVMDETTADIMKDINIDKTDLEYQINKDGYLTVIKLKFNMTAKLPVEESEQEMSMSIDMTTEYLNPGSPVTIDFPDFSDYTAIDDIYGDIGDDFDFGALEDDFDLGDYEDELNDLEDQLEDLEDYSDLGDFTF